MPKYTFEELMAMDIFASAKAIESMSVEERKQVILPDISPTHNTTLKEAMLRTPGPKHIREL